MRNAVRWWLIIFGVVCIGIALTHVFFGAATIIGGGTVSATVDSELRFYAILFLAFGAAYVWGAGDIVGRAGPINLLGAIFFVGGLARLVSWAAEGAPHWFFQVMTVVEFLIPPINFLLVRRVVGSPVAAVRG